MVTLELVKSRSQAAILIKQLLVQCNGKIVKKPSMKVSENDEIIITEEQLYVSRGAFKLIRAIETFDLNLKKKVVADCGASTGGFTEVSLLNGASKVYAIDVGHGQLAESLVADARVINIEGTNLKFPIELPEKVDFCVVDLSFISIRLVYKNIANLLKAGGKAIVLIKPQFEAGKDRLGKNGLVSAQVREAVLEEVKTWFVDNSFEIEKLIESPILGNKSGNTEYLALIK